MKGGRWVTNFMKKWVRRVKCSCTARCYVLKCGSPHEPGLVGCPLRKGQFFRGLEYSIGVLCHFSEHFFEVRSTKCSEAQALAIRAYTLSLISLSEMLRSGTTAAWGISEYLGKSKSSFQEFSCFSCKLKPKYGIPYCQQTLKQGQPRPITPPQDRSYWRKLDYYMRHSEVRSIALNSTYGR